MIHCKQLWKKYVLGRSLDKIKIDAQEKGDLGLVAEVGSSHCMWLMQGALILCGDYNANSGTVILCDYYGK